MATTTYITPKFRCSFMNVFQPKANDMKAGNPLEFSVTALFPKTADLSGLKQAWEKVCREEKQLGNRVPDDLRPLYSQHKDDKGMISDGDKKYAKAAEDKKASYEAYKGCFTANFSSAEDRPPRVVDQHKQEIINAADFKSGDYARAVIELSSYKNKFGPQVSVRLLVIQKLADGASFGGGIAPEVALGMINEVPMEADDLL